MLVGGDPVEESSGSGDGVFAVEEAPGAPPRDTGLVVAWCLTIAAVLTFAGIVAELGGYNGVKIADRVAQAATLTLYPSALVLAAAVAWSLSHPDRRDPEQPDTARACAAALLALCSAATVAASVYGTVVALGFGLFGAHDFAEVETATRLGIAAALLAPAFIGAAALYVIACDRSRVATEHAEDPAATAVEVPSWWLVGPAIAGVLAAAVALTVRAVATAFPASPFDNGPGLGPEFAFGPGPSVGNRIGFASSVFVGLPIAFAALAVVVVATLVAGTREGERDGFNDLIVAFARLMGLLAVAAAGIAIWRAFTTTSTPGRPSFFDIDGWRRTAAIATALAAASLGVAAGYARRRGRPTEGFEPVLRRTRFDPRVVGLCLISAALGYAVFEVITVSKNHGYEIADLLVQLASYIVLTIGLALAAVIVAWSREPTEPSAARVAIDTIAALIASAVFATSAYVIARVLLGGNDALIEVSTQSDLSDKVGYVAVAVANVLLAAAVLHFIWSSRRRAPIDDPDGDVDVAVVDLV